MKKIAMIYQSKYGATRQYAEWIASALNAELFNKSDIKASELESFDTVVYGGGLYAGGISGISLVTKNPCRSLVVFTVGVANPETADYSDILNKNFTPEILAKTKIFHLRGGIDYERLGFVHKSMMAMLKKMLNGKADKTDEDIAILETYGKMVNFIDKDTITPIVEYVNNL